MNSLERLVLTPKPSDMDMYMANPWHGVQVEGGNHNVKLDLIRPRQVSRREMIEFRTMQRMQLEPFVRWEDLSVFMDVFYASYDPAQVASYNGRRFTTVFP
jgi:hypothetical protein